MKSPLVQSFNQTGHQRDMRDDSAEILYPSFLQKATVSRSGMSRDNPSVDTAMAALRQQVWHGQG